MRSGSSRALARERFIVPPESDFDFIYSKREAANLGELINVALENIEDANKAKLENVFRNIDFNSEPALGQTKDRNRRLKNLLDDFRQARPATVVARQPRRHRRRLRIPHRPVRRRGRARRPASSTRRPKSRLCWPSSSAPSPATASATRPAARVRS